MEGETCNGNAHEPVDDSSSGRLTWTIDNFLKLDSKKLYSDIFYAGGYKWRILIFPKGNYQVDHLSMFLDVADSSTLPLAWSKHAQFSLSIISQNPKYTNKKEFEHEFNACENDWGESSFIALRELNDPTRGFLLRGTCTVEAEVWFNEEGKEKLKRNEKADSLKDLKYTVPPKEPTVVETGKSSSFAEFDTLFADIQNLLKGETSKSDNYRNFRTSSWRVEEIAIAKSIFKECLDIGLANVIQSGRDFELEKSLSILISCRPFPENMIDEITKFLSNFTQNFEQYEVAQQDLSDAQEKEKSIVELKTTMKQLYSEFMPVRNRVEAVDHEIAELERQLIERKAMKERLSKRLEVLASRATTWRLELVSAELDMKLSTLKKEQAEKVIGDMDKSWDSLKVFRSLLL